MKSLISIISLALVSFVIVSCENDQANETNNKPEKESSIYNPNGDSELALAMRDAFDQSLEIKKQIEQDSTLDIPSTYLENLKSFHSATPTDPNVKVKEFFAFTDLLYNKVEQLDNASTEDQKRYFNEVVNSCIACHESFCPGPIVKIKKLRIK